MAIYGPPVTETLFSKIIRKDLGNIKQMSPKLNDNMIEALGVHVELWPMIRCGCVPEDRPSPVPDCIACDGTGRYYPEDGRIKTFALMTSQSADRKPKPYGQDDDGKVTVTMQTGITWYHGYQILPFNADGTHKIHLVSERLYRGSRAVVTGEIFAAADNDITLPLAAEARPERLSYPEVTEVLSVYVGGGTETMDKMVEGMDYDFIERTVTWKPGRGPGPGGPYVVNYKSPAVYLLDSPKPRYTGDIELPLWCLASRLDIATRSRLGESRVSS